VVTDAMVEDPAGHRTLYVPTPQLAELLSAACRFDDVQVTPAVPGVRAWAGRFKQARCRFIRHRTPPLLGWLLLVMPTPLTRMHGGWVCWTLLPGWSCQGFVPGPYPLPGRGAGDGIVEVSRQAVWDSIEIAIPATPSRTIRPTEPRCRAGLVPEGVLLPLRR
jgi:hypothetical protein